MKTRCKQTVGGLLKLGIFISCVSPTVEAAKVNVTLSQESGNYGSDYDYTGPRLDLTVNPDASNWYFILGYRNRTHDSHATYNRVDFQTAYRFRFNGGWIQPAFKIRKDTTSYPGGSQAVLDIYQNENKYLFTLTDNWSLYGTIQVGLQKSENKSATAPPMDSDYFIWEIEPGISYSFTPNSKVSVAYYNKGQRSDKGNEWGLTDNDKAQQARLYYNWDTPIGLTISPYMRYSLGYAEASSWYDSFAYTETKALSKLNRYAIQISYPLTSYLRLQAEYYVEKSDFKKGYTLGKEDSTTKYLKLGARFSF